MKLKMPAKTNAKANLNNTALTALPIAVILMALTMLSACSNLTKQSTATNAMTTTNTNQVNISGLTIDNESNTHLNKLEVYLPETNQRLSCGDVAQLRSCDIQFATRKYQRIYVSWVHHQKYRESHLLNLPEALINNQKDNIFNIKINNLNQLEFAD